mmetsp:Transcript_12478/g.31585  ORF Transcript_12478/g.31585 Transcript_12478/m.31585 type:complete len:213 (-) Transcript_12478:98-736(-)
MCDDRVKFILTSETHRQTVADIHRSHQSRGISSRGSREGSSAVHRHYLLCRSVSILAHGHLQGLSQCCCFLLIHTINCHRHISIRSRHCRGSSRGKRTTSTRARSGIRRILRTLSSQLSLEFFISSDAICTQFALKLLITQLIHVKCLWIGDGTQNLALHSSMVTTVRCGLPEKAHKLETQVLRQRSHTLLSIPHCITSEYIRKFLNRAFKT